MPFITTGAVRTKNKANKNAETVEWEGGRIDKAHAASENTGSIWKQCKELQGGNGVCVCVSKNEYI